MLVVIILFFLINFLGTSCIYFNIIINIFFCSRLFGYLKLNTPEEAPKRALLEKVCTSIDGNENVNL